jgi:DNA repair exonuclease SbcCD ATPase subunit
LTVKSKVTGKILEDFKPRSGGHPEIAVCFEHHGDTYELTKAYKGQSGTTHLRVRPGSGPTEDLQGDDAEARLREVLGVEDTARQRKGHDHLGVWPLLWVEQGQSGAMPELTPGARSTLDERLSALSGEMLAGDTGEDLLAKAKAHYDLYFTAAGKTSGSANSPLKQAKDHRDVAEENWRELEARHQSLGAAVDDYVRVANDVAALDGQLPALRNSATEAAQAVKSIEALEQTLSQLTERQKTAKLKLERAEEAVKQRTALRELHADLQKKSHPVDETADQATERLASHQADQRDLKQAANEADAAAAGAGRRHRRAAGHVAAMRETAKRDELADRLAKATAIHEQLRDADAKIKGEPITDTVLDKLRTLESAAREAAIARDAAAAGVRVEALESVSIAIDEDSRDLEAGTNIEQRVADATELRVGTVAKITITPGGEEIAERRKAATEARTALELALADVGAETIDVAVDRARQRRQLKSDRDADRKALAINAPDGVDELDAAVREVAGRVDRYEATCAAQTVEGDDPLPETLEDAEQHEAKCAADAETATESRDEARTHLHAYEAKGQQLETDRQLAIQAQVQHREKLDDCTRQIDAAVADKGNDADLVATQGVAADDLATQRKEADDLAEKIAASDPEGVRQDAIRAEKAVQNATEERAKLRERLVALETQLTAADVHGLHERLAAALAEAEAAAETQEREQRRADAAKLLYETLCICRDEARSRYLAPLQEQVGSLLPVLLPDATLGFDDSLQIQTLDRRSQGADGFDQLSGGCREQVAVLIRLCMAKVLASDEPLVVMLDDCLVNSDDERHERMAAVLTRCSESLQILLATWDWGRYRTLGVPTAQVIDVASLRSEMTA